MTRFMLAIGALILSAAPAFADGAPVNADALRWADAPSTLPRGAQFVVISGDPSKDGPYVVRLRLPAGYRIPAHHHPTSEYVTVLSGTFYIGMGDKLDESKGVELRPGGFAEAPARMNHFAWAGTDAVIQIHGTGPFAITYVNPTDDPSKPQ
jgi:quercetin dioxygenase-like cupin family protein